MGCAEYRGPPLTLIMCSRCGKAATLKGDEEWQCDCPPPTLIERGKWRAEEWLAWRRLGLAERLRRWADRVDL